MIPNDKRIDFVFLFDVAEGNPNGDPRRDNHPRVDLHDGHGLVTDVAVKRKVRDYLNEVHGLPLFITRDPVSLNSLLDQVAEATGTKGAKSKGEEPESEEPESEEPESEEPESEEPKGKKPKGKKPKGKKPKDEKLTGKNANDAKVLRSAELCRQFADVRLFGAMAETGDNPAGRIRGPLQLSFARSLHPINVTSHQLTRIAVTKEEDLSKGSTMTGDGRHVIRYGLYRMTGTFTPSLARRTGCSSADLRLFFEALLRCWARDRASARGVMGCRGLYLAIHDTEDGRCHASDVLDAVRISCPRSPISWADIKIDLTQGQRGVTWLVLDEESLAASTVAC